MRFSKIALAATTALALTASAHAGEFNIGDPVVKNGLQIVPNYLLGIEMDQMGPGMDMDKDAIHLEADIHATKDETHGFKEDEWVPYVTVEYKIESKDGTFVKTGELLPMQAGDGPHYANQVKMGAPGEYTLTYTIDPPSKKGYIRHTDKATGVPAWWKPFSISWKFTYPITPKSEPGKAK